MSPKNIYFTGYRTASSGMREQIAFGDYFANITIYCVTKWKKQTFTQEEKKKLQVLQCLFNGMNYGRFC